MVRVIRLRKLDRVPCGKCNAIVIVDKLKDMLPKAFRILSSTPSHNHDQIVVNVNSIHGTDGQCASQERNGRLIRAQARCKLPLSETASGIAFSAVRSDPRRDSPENREKALLFLPLKASRTWCAGEVEPEGARDGARACARGHRDMPSEYLLRQVPK